MYSLLANEILGLPLWAFILIVAAAVLLVAIIIVVAVVVSKKKHCGEVDGEDAVDEETEQPVKDETKESKSAEPEEKPAEKPLSETEVKPVAKPAAKQESKTEVKTEDNKSAKPANKVYHIAKRKDDGMWQIKAAGGGKAVKLFKTQKEAIAYCKTLAENQDASIMIHKEDGSFRKLTY